MASILNRKFSTFSTDADIQLIGVSARTQTGYVIPNSEHFLPANAAVNEATVDYTDQITIQATPSGAMYSGSSIMKAQLPNKMGPVKDLWLEWSLTNDAVVGAQAAQVITVRGVEPTTGADANLAAGYVVYGFPDYKLWTKPLAHTETPANVAAELSALDPNIVHTITGGGAALSAGAMTLTFNIQDRDMKMQAINYGATTAVGGAMIRTTISTPFVLGGALHLAPTPLQIEYIALLINSDVKSKISGGKLWQSILLHHNEHKLDNVFRRCGFNLDIDEPTIVIPAASATSVLLKLPLYQFIGNWKQMFPARFPNAKFEIEVKFKTNSSIFCSNTISGSATASTGTINNLKVGTMTLWSTYKRLADVDLKDLQAMSLTHPISIRHVWQNTGGMQGTAGVVTTGTKYQAKVLQTADVVAAQFSLEPNGTASADYYIHPLPFASIEFYDSSNNSILGYTQITDAQMQDEIIPYAYGSQDARVNDFFKLYSWVPCNNLDDAKDKGAVRGFYALQGNETFWYTMGTVPTAAAAVSFIPVMHTDEMRTLTFFPDGKCIQE